MADNITVQFDISSFLSWGPRYPLS